MLFSAFIPGKPFDLLILRADPINYLSFADNKILLLPTRTNLKNDKNK